MKLSVDPILRAFIKRAYIENYKRNFYNKLIFIVGLLSLVFIFSILLFPVNYLRIPSNLTSYSKALSETYGITSSPVTAAIILSLIPLITFIPAMFVQVLSSSIPYYFLYVLRINGEIEIFLSYLGEPKKLFSMITKVSLIFTLVYYIVYYVLSTLLIEIFLPVLLSSIQFDILLYVNGFLVILVTLLLSIILNVKFPSLSKPSIAIGRTIQPSLALTSLIIVIELITFEIINSIYTIYSNIIILFFISINLLFALILIILFINLSKKISVEDLISK